MKKKIIFNIFYILLITLIIVFTFCSMSFASYPKLVKTLLDAFDDIKSYLIALSTPVAAVAIASGFLMQKFSFGDEERIRTGKKLIRTSIISYAFILALDLIISLIQNLIA